MANDIYFGNTVIADAKFGGSQVDKIYFGNALVWQKQVSTQVLTVQLWNTGSYQCIASNYAATVRPSTPGGTSGTGATFQVTISGLGIFKQITAITSITNGGNGYAVGDILYLDITSLSEASERTRGQLKVLSVG
jgi:hypothetical protein